MRKEVKSLVFNFLLELKIRIFTVSLTTTHAPLVTRIGTRKECDAKENIIIVDVNETKVTSWWR